MRIDSKSAAPRAGLAKSGTGPRSFAPKNLRPGEGRSFTDKSDGWKAETDFVATPARQSRIDPRAYGLDRTEALAVARLVAAELTRPGLCLGLRVHAASDSQMFSA